MSRSNLPYAITIREVAEAAGVSKSTVSLVLKSSPLIPANTADRVREAAHKLGYIYNSRAGELRGRTSKTIGVVVSDLSNPFFTEILVGVERRLVEAGYIVLMAHTCESVERQNQVLRTMREQGAAGIVLCPAYGTPRGLTQEVASWSMPLVVMIRSLGPGKYDFAGADNERGAYAATMHLLAAGHTRIGFLGGLTGVVLEQRLKGYRAALTGRGLKFDENLLVAAQPTRKGGFETMNTLLDKKPQPTSAVCYNDIVALGALSALGARGMHAGQDFALMGFDNIQDAAHFNPPLSTIDIRPGNLAEQAATLLLNRMETPGRTRQIFLAEPELVIRQSG